MKRKRRSDTCFLTSHSFFEDFYANGFYLCCYFVSLIVQSEASFLVLCSLEAHRVIVFSASSLVTVITCNQCNRSVGMNSQVSFRNPDRPDVEACRFVTSEQSELNTAAQWSTRYTPGDCDNYFDWMSSFRGWGPPLVVEASYNFLKLRLVVVILSWPSQLQC